jgi:hypothetical protein
MTHLALSIFGSEEVFGNFGLWAFLSVGAVVMFGIFIPVVTWMDSRRKEREAFYKAETFRRVAEASGEGAKAAVQLLREEDRLKRIKMIEGLKIGGIVNICIGIGLMIFLRAMLGGGSGSPYLCGMIPGMIGVGLLASGFLVAPPPAQ